MSGLSIIRSSANPFLRRVRGAIAGREPDLIVLEGARLIAEARQLGLALELLLLAADRVEELGHGTFAGADFSPVDPALLDQTSALTSSPGCVALVRRPRERTLEELPLGSDGLVLVTAGVADPGNLGALARTAEAAGAVALCVAGTGASPWGAKAVRGSMGSLLRLPIVRVEDGDSLGQGLRGLGMRQVQAATRGGARLADFDWTGRLALWVASETGRMPRVAEGFEAVSIPMAGGVESLNVGAAAAALLFAAAAQRGRVS